MYCRGLRRVGFVDCGFGSVRRRGPAAGDELGADAGSRAPYRSGRRRQIQIAVPMMSTPRASQTRNSEVGRLWLRVASPRSAFPARRGRGSGGSGGGALPPKDSPWT